MFRSEVVCGVHAEDKQLDSRDGKSIQNYAVSVPAHSTEEAYAVEFPAKTSLAK